MTKLETAEQVIEQLSPDELARFRQWFAAFDGKAWDEQIEATTLKGNIVQIFTTKEQDQQFRDWMATNPQGVYLNKRTKNTMMLHKVSCLHLNPVGENYPATNNTKVAATNRKELHTWADENGMTVVDCKTCKPD